jgi:hypothetical protein
LDILWKTFSLSSPWRYGPRRDRENPHKYGVVIALTVKLHGSMAALRSAPRSFGSGRHREISRVTQTNGKSAVGKPTRRGA